MVSTTPVNASISVLISASLANSGHYGDPGRIAAQIVSGIGFLGGGTIIQSRGTILGLTTAATIWAVAALGICIGIGHWDIAVISAITIVLTGQSMLRSDLRATKPSAVPTIAAMLKGDVVFTNLEAAIAEPGETTREGRGFLTPPEALDALTAMGFNLLALSGNHAFDLKETGIRNTLRETERRKIARAGTGNTLAEAIVRMLKNKELGQRMGDAGLARVNERFTVERMVSETAGVYARVAGRPHVAGTESPPAAG